MLIDCPYCGKRSHQEFNYIGDACKENMPALDANHDIWTNYVFIRDNPDQWHDEIWQHVGACRAYLRVTRHMRSHDIKHVTVINGQDNIDR